MNLRKSRFIHQIPVGTGRILLVHAVSHQRLVVDQDISDIIDCFAQPRVPSNDEVGLANVVPRDGDALAGCIASLLERGILTEKSDAEELAEVAAKLRGTVGRDPIELLERFRRELKEGPDAYWSVGTARGVSDLDGYSKRLDVVLLGDCDIHMESDFLRREAAKRGIDLRVAATSPDDFRFVSEHQHDAVLIGALRARHAITDDVDTAQKAPHSAYVAEASHILEKLRERTAAPILIDNLPEPTVQPLGLAERGLSGHRTRFRVTNVVLANLAESYPDVHVVDIAAALAAIGSERMLDDGQFGFTHMGSPGWLLQRPESEKAAVHGIFPDMAPLAQFVGGDPYCREATIARTHVDILSVALGLDRKKCVIVDLDGVLWPGVLAETGSPFAWDPSVSGAFSYVGLYFGLHEALLCLKKRGIVLACVSKNDEATVRELWKYPDHYPSKRLLTPDDFVTWRVNWTDKVENIRSIADEVGFALDALLFIDDHPIERDRVRQRLPQVEVWGEDLFGLRRLLLNDPRLQLPRITEEAASRSNLVKAQLGRQRLRTESLNESEYVASLQIQCRVEIVPQDGKLDRISELFQRTTQFNATGRSFSPAELKVLCGKAHAQVFSLHVSDRLGDHGLVGAAVIEHGEFIGLVLSCRVLGLGVEHNFLRHIIEALQADYETLTGRIARTSRNIPVRNVYRDNGFVSDGSDLWHLDLARIRATRRSTGATPRRQAAR